MVTFHSYVNVYQRVYSSRLLMNLYWDIDPIPLNIKYLSSDRSGFHFGVHIGDYIRLG